MGKKLPLILICGVIIVIICVYCYVSLFYFQHRKSIYITKLPSVGLLEYQERGSNASVKVTKHDGSVIKIHYKNAKATDKIVFHPQDHPLAGKVQPATDEKNLYLATELLPTLIEISKGEKVVLDENILILLEDYPPDLYRLNFKKEPNTYYLQLFDDLFLSGYDFRPNAIMPYVSYWGPETGDKIGDDVIYCGEWILNKFCYNQSLQIKSDSLFRVKAGDIIHFRDYTLHVRYIDHDNDSNPWNNRIILYIESPKRDLDIIQRSTGRKPISYSSDTLPASIQRH